MTRYVHRIALPLIFPHGLSAGESSLGNRLVIARDGLGRPVLRGTSLAGALRHAWACNPASTLIDDAALFGAHFGDDDAIYAPSPLEVPDCVIDCGKAGPVERMHNQINRHAGAVLGAALYAIEALPPGARTEVVFWLHADDHLHAHAATIASRLAGMFENGLLLGGKSNRGIGMARLDGTGSHRAYDLASDDDHAAWLDDHRQWRRGSIPGAKAAQALAITPDPADEAVLVVDFTLRVPRGQDFLIAESDLFDSTVQPRSVIAADGSRYLQIPGSSIRGVMRSWINRLAARDGFKISDSLQNYQAMAPEDYTGEAIGWGFMPRDKREVAIIDCPVMKLFGTFQAAGRLYISDALVPADAAPVQERKHVAIDRVTGGTCEGLFFGNQVVLADPTSKAAFTFRMIIRDPQEHEARWLARTLKAIDLGLVRIGSSKAGGRLGLAATPMARGPFAENFDFEVQS